MKKLLISLTLVTILMLGVVGVIAEDQGTDVEVTADVSVSFDVDPLDFGSVPAGGSNTVLTTLTAGGSNIEITAVSVAPDTGTIFDNTNVLFDLDGGGLVAPASVPVTLIAALGDLEIDVQLNVPSGTTSGDQTGTITYTIMEALP